MPRLLRNGVLITCPILIICTVTGCTPNGDFEETTDPLQPEEVYFKPPVATTVVVDPSPRARAPRGGTNVILPDTDFVLTFDAPVEAVTVNGTVAIGALRHWSWQLDPNRPPVSLFLNVEWKNRDGSEGYITVGPYEIAHVHGEPPVISSGTVADGSTDVDPTPINVHGFRFDFNEDVTGTIKLTDEGGVDLNWIGSVAGQTATLTPIAGQELVNDTTYKIQFNVRDADNSPLKTTITFVTKPK